MSFGFTDANALLRNVCFASARMPSVHARTMECAELAALAESSFAAAAAGRAPFSLDTVDDVSSDIFETESLSSPESHGLDSVSDDSAAAAAAARRASSCSRSSFLVSVAKTVTRP